MRTLIELDATPEGLLATRHPAQSPYFQMFAHLRALAAYPMMKLPQITPEALWKAVQMGLKPKVAA